MLGSSASGKPIRFRVSIDGKAPGENHGVDADVQGNGIVTAYRPYQLVRQRRTITDHISTIGFQDAGVHAFSRTFG